MTKEIEKQIEDWKFIQGLGFDVLKMLNDEQLGFTVGKNMGTLGEQFRHMARVRFQYTEAIETKKVDNTIEKIDPVVAQYKDKLIELWERANQKLIELGYKPLYSDINQELLNQMSWFGSLTRGKSQTDFFHHTVTDYSLSTEDWSDL